MTNSTCRHEWSTVPVDGVGDEVLRVCMICGERRRDEVATLRRKRQNCSHTWTTGTLAGSSVPARFCSVCNEVREYPINYDEKWDDPDVPSGDRSCS